MTENPCYEDFCAGISPNPAADSDQYFCGDKRLGPSIDRYPTTYPLITLFETYDPFAGDCPAVFLKKWTDANGAYKKAPDLGFQLDINNDTIESTQLLTTGMRIDRFGSETSTTKGVYFSPAGVPYGQRSIPPSTFRTYPDGVPNNYHIYTVLKAFKVQSGPIAPLLGQSGQGTQYYVPDMSVPDLIHNRNLAPVKIEEVD